jgi:hypothetical protein
MHIACQLSMGEVIRADKMSTLFKAQLRIKWRIPAAVAGHER